MTAHTRTLAGAWIVNKIRRQQATVGTAGGAQLPQAGPAAGAHARHPYREKLTMSNPKFYGTKTPTPADKVTFHYRLTQTVADHVRHYAATITTSAGRSHIVRDLLDKASKPAKWKRKPIGSNYFAIPRFEPGETTTADYVKQFDSLNKLRPVESQRIDRPAPMLDPALPELWKEMDVEPDLPDWLAPA
jgi:hypothetical protein